MPEFWCKSGDVLIYRDAPTLATRLIEDGEKLQYGPEAEYVYHTAVALDAYNKIEANGSHVAIAPIDYGRFETYRPAYKSQTKLNRTLAWSRTQEGKLYGWFGIADQVLRKLSFGHVHMPRLLIQWANARWPYCSTLTAAILARAGIPIQLYPPPDPEAVWVAVNKYKVNG